jgi:hypothetical protein
VLRMVGDGGCGVWRRAVVAATDKGSTRSCGALAKHLPDDVRSGFGALDLGNEAAFRLVRKMLPFPGKLLRSA